MNNRVKNAVSICVVIGCGAYLSVKGYQANQRNLIGDSAAVAAAEAAGESKLDNLRSLTEGALKEQRAKLAVLDAELEKLNAEVDVARKERNITVTSIKNMEKVFATLGLPVPAQEKAQAAQAPIAKKETERAVAAAPSESKLASITPEVSKPAAVAAAKPSAKTFSNPAFQDASEDAAPAAEKAKSANHNSSELGAIVDRANISNGKPLAKLQDANSVSLNGTGLVLFDKNRPRISLKAYNNMKPVLQKLRGWRVGEVTVKVAEGTPESHVNVVKTFIEKTYGWKTKIETVNSTAASLAPIEINVSGK